MSDDPNKTENEQPEENEHQVLKTFDMYHFFSRKDVLLAIAFIVIMLIIVIYKTVFAPEAV